MLSFSSIEQALSAALEKADQKDDVMLVFGSFYVVEAAKSYFETL
jgi:folylpolyglutamate synthase/dihydropteroate synthase